MASSKKKSRTSRQVSVPLLAGVAIALTAIGILAVLMTVQGAAPKISADQGAPGRLETSQPTIDLGRVPFDKLAEARFELANTGGDTVRLVGTPRVRMLEGC